MARLSFLRVAVAASLGLAFGAFSTIAHAGTQSNQDWFQDQPPQPPSSAPATAIGGAGGRDFGGPNGPAVQQPPPRVVPQQANTANSGDFPGDQMQDWVNAYARMARTRALLRRAESNLDRSVRDAQLDFEQSREYRDAVAAEKKAYDEYTAERARALKSVLDDPKYVAALQLRDKMGEQLAHLRSEVRRSKSGPIPNDILLAMASQKLQFATDAHNLEAVALEKDDHLKDVRKQLVDANARVSQLRADFDASIRSNPEILQARRNLEEMRVAVVTAEAYFNASSVAASLATDYSYFRHRWDGQVGPQVVWGPGWGY